MSVDAADALEAVAVMLDEVAVELAELPAAAGRRDKARDRLLTARNTLIDEAGRLRAHDTEDGR